MCRPSQTYDSDDIGYPLGGGTPSAIFKVGRKAHLIAAHAGMDGGATHATVEAVLFCQDLFFCRRG